MLAEQIDNYFKLSQRGKENEKNASSVLVSLVFFCFFSGSAFAVTNQQAISIFSYRAGSFEAGVNFPAESLVEWNFDANEQRESLKYFIDSGAEGGGEDGSFFRLSVQKAFGDFRVLGGSAVETTGNLYAQVGINFSHVVNRWGFFGETSIFPGLNEEAETHLDVFGQMIYLFDTPYFTGVDFDYNGRLNENPFVGVFVGTYVWRNHISVHVRTDGGEVRAELKLGFFSDAQVFLLLV